MPGKRAPRRRDDRILLRVDWRSRAVNVDHEQLANVFEVAEPKRFRSGIGADDAHPEKVRAHDGGGGRDQRIEVLGLGACTPTIGEGVGIKRVGRIHARAVMKSGAQHAVGQLLLGNARAYALQSAAARLGQHRILGNGDLLAGVIAVAGSILLLCIQSNMARSRWRLDDVYKNFFTSNDLEAVGWTDKQIWKL